MNATPPYDRAEQCRAIYITSYDMERLRNLLTQARDTNRLRADLTERTARS